MAGMFTGVLNTTKKPGHEPADRPPFFRSDHFWHGVLDAYESFGRTGRLFDVTDPWEADYRALRGDWEAVGLDMRRVMRRFEAEHLKELAEQQRLFDPEKPID